MRTWKRCLLLLALGLPLGLAAAGPATHRGHGVLLEVREQGKVLLIRHEAIRGFMPAMTMTFALDDPARLKGIQAGQAVDFTLTQRGNFWPITALRRSKAQPAPSPAPTAVAHG
jgi:Cu/Ag efflux protein CusF